MGFKTKNYEYITQILKRHGLKGKILDAAAGSGNKTIKLINAGLQVYPADIIPEQFQIKELECKYVDLNKPLPYEDRFFDNILCAEGIEHLENQFGFIKECFRILKPKGKLIITTPNLLYLWARIYYLLTGNPRPRSNFPSETATRIGGGHINLITYHKLRYILYNNGFSTVGVQGIKLSANSILWTWLVPLMYLYNRWVNLLEKNPDYQQRNTEVRKCIFSLPLLFCKKLIVVAEKHVRAPNKMTIPGYSV